MTSEMISRFKGCLLGGAIGDALGAPVEFDSLNTIMKHTQDKGVTDFMEAYGGIGKITDDTQMSLFTAEALLRAYFAHGRTNQDCYIKANGDGLLRWYKTQDERFPNPRYSGLLADGRFYSRRAPGATCLSAIRAMLRPTQFANNNSKGCGTVMRMAPVGLFAHSTGAIDAFQMGCDYSRQTHGHATGYIAGGAFAHIIMLLADGVSLVDAVLFTMAEVKKAKGYSETHIALNEAVNHFLNQTPPAEAIRLMGEGWVAEEALAISVYCALMAKDFAHGVLMAVNHDGDTDSTGSMTGNMLGVMYGVEAIPARWVKEVELADVCERVAEDLALCPTWTQDCEGAKRYYAIY